MENDCSRVDLQHYIERLVAHESALNIERFNGVEKALQKADIAMNLRLEGLNEFRRQLEAGESRYAQMSQLQALNEKFEIRLERLERSESITAGKTAMIWTIAIVGIALIGAMAAILKT